MRLIRSPQRGLTLIELTIGLAVVAVLATLALPSLAGMLGRHRLAAAAEDLALDLAEARFQAAQAGQPRHVVFRPGADWCYAVARTPDCDCRPAPGPAPACQLKAVRAADLPGVTLAAADDARFDPAAVATLGGHAEWRSADGRQRLQVRLSGLGRARVCTTGGAEGGVKGYEAC